MDDHADGYVRHDHVGAGYEHRQCGPAAHARIAERVRRGNYLGSTGYILSNVIIMPIVAFLSSRFGRKNFYIFSVLSFTVASMLCGIAWDLSSMVIFRIIQGIGGGALIPISQSILRETYPPEEQAMAMGIYGMGIVLGPALGPTLGGWLTDNYSWPWIFYINVPIGIINILMILRFIKDPHFLVREREKWIYRGFFHDVRPWRPADHAGTGRAARLV